MFGRLTGGTDDLLVAFVADEKNVVVRGGEASRLRVNLRHQWAGRVNGLQTPFGGLRVHLGRHTVRGEHDDRAGWHLVVLLHEDCALASRVDTTCLL